MWCFSAPTQYNPTKRKLDNLNRELTAFGSKPLTNQEKRRFRNRYKQHLNRVENIEVTRKEKRKLQEQIHQFREKFRHLGIFEMESDATGPVSKPPEMAENNARDLQGHDVPHNKFTSNVRSDKLSNNRLEARLQSLKKRLENSDFSNPRDLQPQFDDLVKEIKECKTLSSRESQDLLNSCKELEKCFEEATVNPEEQHPKFGCRKQTVHSDIYIAQKEVLQNLIAWYKLEEETGKILVQYKNLKKYINISSTQRSALESHELDELCKELERTIKEKEQTKYDTRTLQTNSEINGNTSNIDLKKLESYSPFRNQLDFESEKKCDSFTVLNKRDQDTRRQEGMANTAKIHCLCNKTKHSSDGIDYISSRGMSFRAQDHEERKDNIDLGSSSYNKQTKLLEAFRTTSPFQEENVPIFHGVSSYGENIRSKRVSSNESTSENYSAEQCSQHNKETIAAQEITHNCKSVEQVENREGSRRANSSDDTKYSDYNRKDTNYGSIATPQKLEMMQHYHNNISYNQDRGDTHCNREHKAEDKCPQYVTIRIEDNTPHEHISKSGTSDIIGHAGTYTTQMKDSTKHQCSSRMSENWSHERCSQNFGNYTVHEIAQEAKEDEPLQILDVHQYFRDDFDLNSVDSMEISDRIDTIHRHAKTFCSKVHSFDEEKYSLEYFILDEKLMRLIEKLDKIKIQHDPELTNKKIEVIQFIKHLHSVLDQRAKE